MTTLIIENSPIYEKAHKKKSQKEIKIYERQKNATPTSTSTTTINMNSIAKKNFTSKDDLLMESLTEFFTHKKNLNQMLPIVTKRANISLRILDWFVTNFAKEEPVVYTFNDKIFNVYNSYKDQLTAYSKKRFDPFRRRCQKEDGEQIDVGIKFWYAQDKFIETTVGQLNFFKWAIEKNVLAYVVENLSDLVNKMIMTTKKEKDSEENENASKEEKGGKGKGKGKAKKTSKKSEPKIESGTETFTNLTVDKNDKTGDVAISATKMITKKENVKIVLSFD